MFGQNDDDEESPLMAQEKQKQAAAMGTEPDDAGAARAVASIFGGKTKGSDLGGTAAVEDDQSATETPDATSPASTYGVNASDKNDGSTPTFSREFQKQQSAMGSKVGGESDTDYAALIASLL